MNVIMMLYFGIVSCSKHSSGQPDAGVRDFPAIVGTTWRYVVTDSIHQIIDTQTVTITGTTTLTDGRIAKVVKSYTVFRTDTLYTYLVQQSGTARYYTRSDGADFDKIYSFPLKTGSQWLGQNIRDTNRVTGTEQVMVPAGNFSAFVIQREFRVPNNHIREREWFANGIGMVQRDYYETNIGFFVNTHSVLLDYSIPK